MKEKCDEKCARANVAHAQKRLAYMMVYGKLWGRRLFDENVIDEELERLTVERTTTIMASIARMIRDDAWTLANLLGRTIWNMWDDGPDAVRRAVHRDLGIEFRNLLRLGYFPDVEEDKSVSRTKTKQYVMKGTAGMQRPNDPHSRMSRSERSV